MKTLYVFAGNNGSGKSTYRSLMRNEMFTALDVDSDHIERVLDSQGIPNPKKEAGKLAIRQIENAMRRGINFSFETTLSSKLSVRQIKQAESLGYYIEMYYLYLDHVDLNIERIKYRQLSGGHGIPTEDVIRRDRRSVENLVKLKHEINRLHVINNTGRQGIKVAEVVEGAIFEMAVDIPIWVYELE